MRPEDAEEMFEQLVKLHRPALTRFAARQMGAHAGLAEDVVQEALLSAHQAVAAGERPAHPRAWLYTIVRNAAINAVRSARPTGEIEERLGTSDEAVPAAVEQGEWIEWLMGAVGQLPARQRDALVGHVMEGRSHREIAARLQTTVPAVKSLIGRARRSLSAENSFPAAGFGAPFAAAARGLRALLARGPLAGKAGGVKGFAGVLAQAALAATVTTGVLLAVHGGVPGSVLASPGPAKLPARGEHPSRAQVAMSRRHTETKHQRERRIHREGHRAIAACTHGRPIRGHYGEAALKYAVKNLSSDALEYTECERLFRFAEMHPAGHRRAKRRVNRGSKPNKPHIAHSLHGPNESDS
jgi:RNA polymerase sigma-70 factor, ECF subfamily